MPQYASVSEVQDEAGLLNRVRNESVGTGDGTEKSFELQHKPVAELVVIVNDGGTKSVVNVIQIDRIIKFRTAPASDATISASYKWSPVDDDSVEKRIQEATQTLQTALNGRFDYQTKWSKKIPPDAQNCVRLMAAGMVMFKDFGVNSPNEEYARNGYRKYDRGKDAMKYLVMNLIETTGRSRVEGDIVNDDVVFPETGVQL